MNVQDPKQSDHNTDASELYQNHFQLESRPPALNLDLAVIQNDDDQFTEAPPILIW